MARELMTVTDGEVVTILTGEDAVAKMIADLKECVRKGGKVAREALEELEEEL